MLLIGELKPLTFIVNMNMCLCFPAFFSLFILCCHDCHLVNYSSVELPWFAGFGKCFFSSCVYSLCLSILCIVVLVHISSFSLFLLCNVFISTLNLKLSFPGYSNLVWQLFSFRLWNDSFQALHNLGSQSENRSESYWFASKCDIMFVSCGF